MQVVCFEYDCIPVVLLSICVSFCFASVVFVMFAYCLPVCDMWIVEHANANKHEVTAPLQAGCGKSLRCAVPPLTLGVQP